MDGGRAAGDGAVFAVAVVVGLEAGDAVADEDGQGKLRTLGDPYGRDAAVAKALDAA